PYAAPDLVAEHGDAAIRRAEVLQAVDGDGPLRHLGLVVTGAPLTFLVGFRGELAGEHDAAIGPPSRGHTFGLADMPELDEHRVGVVLGHDPAAHHRAAEWMLLAAIFPNRSYLLQVGHDILDHPRPDVVPDPPGGDIDYAHRRLDEVQLRQYPELVSK